MTIETTKIPRRQKCVDKNHPYIGGADDVIDDKSELTVGELVGNKDYNAASYSGMGRVTLKKNIVNGVNTLTQGMINQSNTVYIIQYDFTLGEDITIPANCVLEFDGGSIGNGTLIGQNTALSNPQNGIFKQDIKISGTWKVGYISTDFFEDLSEENALDNVEALNNADMKTIVYIGNGDYYYNLATTPVLESGLTVKSNTEYVFNGTIHLVNNNHGYYGIFELLRVHDVYIHGNGSIIGDKEESTATSESGHAFRIRLSYRIKIEGITMSQCIGDGVYIDGYSDFNVIGCNISHCGRQGVSVVKGKNVHIIDCDISHIWAPYGSSAMWAIDIETNPNAAAENVFIRGCNIHDTDKGICVTHAENTIRIGDIYIVDNIINTTQDIEGIITKGRAIMIDGGAENVVIKNNNIIGGTHGPYDSSWIDAVEVKGDCIFDSNNVDGGIVTGNELLPIIVNNIVTAKYCIFRCKTTSNNTFNMTCASSDADLFYIYGEFCRNNVRILKGTYRTGAVFNVGGENSFIHDNVILDSKFDSSIYGNVYNFVRGNDLAKIYNNIKNPYISSSREKNYTNPVIIGSNSDVRGKGTNLYDDNLKIPIIYNGTRLTDFMGYPIAEISTNVNFAYKEVGVKATTAKITSIKGKTTFIHQVLKNGNFADSSEWSAYNTNVSLSISDNKMTVTAISDGNIIAQCSLNNQNIVGHTYLLLIKMPDEYSEGLVFEGPVSGRGVKKLTASIYYRTFTANIAANGFYLRKNEQLQGASFVIERVCLIDLTEMYGDVEVPSDEIVLSNINTDVYFDYGKSLIYVKNFKVRSKTRNGYVIDECPIDIMGIVTNEGLRSCGSGDNITYDEITAEKFIRRTIKRAYQTNDENNPAYTTDGTNTITPLGTPVETTITFDKQYSVKEDGFEEVIATDLSSPSVPVLNGVVGYK